MVIGLGAAMGGCHFVYGDYELDESGECTSGEFRCEGSVLDECQAGKWVKIEGCGTVKICNADRGRCDECQPGQARCLGKEVHKCDDGEWFVALICSESRTCVEEGAFCAACGAGDAYCDGDTLKTCNAERTGWNNDACGQGCTSEPAPHCKECDTPGAKVCSSATTLRSCDESFVWAVQNCPGSCVANADTAYCTN